MIVNRFSEIKGRRLTFGIYNDMIYYILYIMEYYGMFNPKKLTALLLALIIASVGIIIVSADEYITGTVSLKTVFYDSDGNTDDVLCCEPGEKIRADVYFTSDFPVKSMAFLFQYNSNVLELDTEKLEPVGGEYVLTVNTPLLGAGTFKDGKNLLPAASKTDSTGAILVRLIRPAYNQYENVNAFSLYFEISKTVTPGEFSELIIAPGSVMTPDNKYNSTEVSYITNPDLIGINPNDSGSPVAKPADFLSASGYNLIVNSFSNAVGLPLPKHLVTFMADGKIINTVEFEEGAGSVTAPPVPEKTGYTGSWENYTLGNTDIIVHAVYSPIVYTATFVADGKTVSTAAFTVENKNITPPPVPDKPGYAGRWAPYTLGAADITINAIYEYINPTANSSLIVKSSATVDYLTIVKVTARAENVPAGYKVALYDGDTFITAGDNTYVSYDYGEMKSGREFNARIINADNVTMKNDAGNELRANISISVNSGFFKKIIAFFKWLFRCLPSVTVGP